MSKTIDLNPNCLKPIRKINERLVSYNIEMTEVTGGTFWKAYTPGQIAGTEKFQGVKEVKDFTSTAELTQYYPPIDLYHECLRELAKKLGPAWVRVSGTWATKTYYDFEGMTGGKAPESYASVLTREQWIGVLDFVTAVGGKLLISVSNCAGDHPDGGPQLGKGPRRPAGSIRPRRAPVGHGIGGRRGRGKHLGLHLSGCSADAE